MSLRELRSLSIALPGRPPTTNAERKGAHWSVRSATVAQYREQAAWLAVKHLREVGLRRLEPPVAILATPHHKDNRSPQDVGACAPAVKAMVDGFVDAGVIPGDDPRYVRRITYEAPIVGGWDGIVVVVSELAT